jgi:DNA adenine methylase
VSVRVAKVPGSKWRLVDWYVAHLPAQPVYVEPYFGSGAVLFGKPRSSTEVVSDVDGRVVALFRCLRDRPQDLARVVELTPWAREEWQAVRNAPDADDELELARQFLVASWQSHGLRSLPRSGWRHDGPSGRRGKSVAREWMDLPDKIILAARRLQGVHIENRPALDVIARYRGEEVVLFLDPPYPEESVHGKRDRLYRHEMMRPEDHVEMLTLAREHPGPVLACSYRNDIYDREPGDADPRHRPRAGPRPPADGRARRAPGRPPARAPRAGPLRPRPRPPGAARARGGPRAALRGAGGRLRRAGGLLRRGWEVVEAATTAEHGQARVEALYLSPVTLAALDGRRQGNLFDLGAAS